jgi:hypothetical protein
MDNSNLTYEEEVYKFRLRPHLIRFLADLTCKNNISIDEVLATLLRNCAEYMGCRCRHQSVLSDNGKHYCRNCWAPLTQVEPPVCRDGKIIKFGKYEPAKTFMDSESDVNNTTYQ